jgi:hypothetical protein
MAAACAAFNKSILLMSRPAAGPDRIFFRAKLA